MFKDWPIFGKASIYVARLALASKYQGKFPEAHEALISLREKLSQEKIDSTLAAAGIDVARAKGARGPGMAATRDVFRLCN